MNKIPFSLIKVFILLSLALGLVILREPSSAKAVTTLTIGDGTVYFDDSNNYYQALSNALKVAQNRGLVSQDINFDYLLQIYPFLEYIDGDSPSILLDFCVSDNGKIVIFVSNRSAYNRGYGISETVVNFGGFTLLGKYVDNEPVCAPISNVTQFQIGSSKQISTYNGSNADSNDLLLWSYTRNMGRLDTLVEEVESGKYLSLCFVVNNTYDGIQYIGNSVAQRVVGNLHPVVLSNYLYMLDLPSSIYDGDPQSAQFINPAETISLFTDIAYSIVGESLGPEVVIPLITPSPVPTQPYSNITPTPMVVDTGIFGFGGSNVNVSSDYQNVLSAWIEGLNKLDNIIFLRVLVDTVLTSNVFSWILIPVSFMLIAWVWGLKPFNHKGGGDDD